MYTQKYLMKEITPKSGVLRNVHVGILGKECSIITISEIATFHYVKDNGENRWVYTSPIEDVNKVDNLLIIETRNTVYELEVIE